MQELFNGQWVKKNRLRIHEVFCLWIQEVRQKPEEFLNVPKSLSMFVNFPKSLSIFFQVRHFVNIFLLRSSIFQKVRQFFLRSSIFPKVRQYFFKFVNFPKSSSISFYVR